MDHNNQPRHILQNELRKLFQYDVSDLDFGIYRILNRKKKQIEQAETLLEATWRHPAMYEFTAGLAYFWFKIANHKSKVEYWLKKFESKEPNLNHFAYWYREQYKNTKEWLVQQS